MKALTICQPYAERIRLGLKPIENRTWPTSYRGPLLIHAGKSRDWMDDGDEQRYPEMAFGAAVALSELVDCVQVEHLPEHLRGHEDANGPWCWLLEKVQSLDKPVPCRGAQGLWVPDDTVIEHIALQAEGATKEKCDSNE